MGTLKPGATYIYERANGVIYRRESGSDPSTRVIAGYDYDSRSPDGRPLHDHIIEDRIWRDIRRAAKTNPTLQDALDRVKVLYELSKTDE